MPPCPNGPEHHTLPAPLIFVLNSGKRLSRPCSTVKQPPHWAHLRTGETRVMVSALIPSPDGAVENDRHHHHDHHTVEMDAAATPGPTPDADPIGVIEAALVRLVDDVGVLAEEDVVRAFSILKATDLPGYLRLRHAAKKANRDSGHRSRIRRPETLTKLEVELRITRASQVDLSASVMRFRANWLGCPMPCARRGITSSTAVRQWPNRAARTVNAGHERTGSRLSGPAPDQLPPRRKSLPG